MKKGKQKYQDYLSVNELAKQIGYSPQWVYKVVKSRESFKPYIVTIDGRVKIDPAAVKEYFGKQTESEKAEEKARQEAEQRAKEEAEQKERQEAEEKAEGERLNSDYISFLKEQVRTKDQQIADLNERLKAEQILRVNADQRILLLEQKAEQATTTNGSDQETETTKTKTTNQEPDATTRAMDPANTETRSETPTTTPEEPTTKEDDTSGTTSGEQVDTTSGFADMGLFELLRKWREAKRQKQ